MTTSAIEAVGLSKKFRVPTERRTSLKERLIRGRAPAPREFWALKDATFTVPKGSSMGLIGQNGSGKSTALKVLTGIYRPTAGHVQVNGSVSALLEVGAGFHPELTGRENIRLNATILGFTNREIDRLMDQIVEFADIGDHIDGPIKHYSSGMYVRLGFAVAVMVRPEILLVDEVIAVGDEQFQRKCYDYLNELRRSGTSMIVVSHGLGQINDLCDEAVWLEGGSPRLIGPSRVVTKAYVDQVNATELARLRVPDRTEEPDAPEPRRGSGEIRVGDILFLGPNGPSPVLPVGQELVIRLPFTATEVVEDAAFAIEVVDGRGSTVMSVRSDHERCWTIPRGSGQVEFHMGSCLLTPGLYDVRAAVTREASIVDADDAGARLVVRGTSESFRGAYVQPGSWSLRTGSSA